MHVGLPYFLTSEITSQNIEEWHLHCLNEKAISTLTQAWIPKSVIRHPIYLRDNEASDDKEFEGLAEGYRAWQSVGPQKTKNSCSIMQHIAQRAHVWFDDTSCIVGTRDQGTLTVSDGLVHVATSSSLQPQAPTTWTRLPPPRPKSWEALPPQVLILTNFCNNRMSPVLHLGVWFNLSTSKVIHANYL